MNRLNKTESAVSGVVGSLYFLRIRFFRLFKILLLLLISICNIFQFKIDFVIFSSFLRFKFSPFCIPVAGQCKQRYGYALNR